MPFQIIRGDITKLKVDAIVNAACPTLLGGGGVDGAIHRAAGPELVKACRFKYPEGCETGEAKMTLAYRLPCKRVIHTVGPIWHGGNHGEKELLISCYQKSLELAVEYDLHSIAFPLISSGAYGYPKEEALQVAVDTITDFLKDHEISVYLVIFQKSDYEIGKDLAADISFYLKENQTGDTDDFLERWEEERDYWASEQEKQYLAMPEPMEDGVLADRIEERCVPAEHVLQKKGALELEKQQEASFTDESGEEIVFEVEESFSEMVLRKIDEKGMTDPECYKKANLDRKLFSKIRSNVDYQPSRATALALGIALELSLSELQELLEKAGYTLSHARRADLIVEYFVKKGKYDIFEINKVLFAFEEPTI